MPEMDGFEATRKIRELATDKSKTPVMAMTANVTKEEVEKCFQSGMDEYIAKPFKPNDLLSKISALVNRGAKK
jgi:CheY-like chemotaxis protein